MVDLVCTLMVENHAHFLAIIEDLNALGFYVQTANDRDLFEFYFLIWEKSSSGSI